MLYCSYNQYRDLGGQMTAEEKNQVSHRFHAVEKMREVLRELF